MPRTKAKSMKAKKKPAKKPTPSVAVIMGSTSDLPVMENATKILDELKIPYDVTVVSAHRTPRRFIAFAESLEEKGIKLVIAGAGGAAHLPGMTAALTVLPVLGVPIQSRAMDGLDALLSIAQMPSGVPVGALAVGNAGATNAALLAASILGVGDEKLAARYAAWRVKRSADGRAPARGKKRKK